MYLVNDTPLLRRPILHPRGTEPLLFLIPLTLQCAGRLAVCRTSYSPTTTSAMSVKRSPPSGKLMSDSGSAGGSTSNLSCHGDEDSNINKNLRKRKERSHEYDYKKDLADFRKDMMAFLKDFANTQNDNLAQIRQEITEIKDEFRTMKSVTENLTLQYKNISEDMQTIKSDQTITQNKIKHIENDLTTLKNKRQGNPSSESLFSTHEELIVELKSRHEREKNIIIVGMNEPSNKNSSDRRKHDYDEVFKIINLMIQNCPEPIKCMRLGKYNPDKNRPIKVLFTSAGTPKLLLRNKSKLPENIRMYSDQTPAQKNYMEALSSELKRREENGETDLTIKYIKGVPKIIKREANPKN